MPKFDIMLYLVPNLTLCITFVKFTVKFDIASENTFYVKMSNFNIGTQIWHCIGDALRVWLKEKKNPKSKVKTNLQSNQIL